MYLDYFKKFILDNMEENSGFQEREGEEKIYLYMFGSINIRIYQFYYFGWLISRFLLKKRLIRQFLILPPNKNNNNHNQFPLYLLLTLLRLRRWRFARRL